MDEIKKKYFSASEALSKVGRKVISLVDFSGAPEGTIGVVKDPFPGDYTHDGAFVRSIPIAWQLQGREKKPLVDWFTKDEYQRFLKEV